VQRLTNEAAIEVEMSDPGLPAGPYGTAVHYCVKEKILKGGYKNLTPEASFFKMLDEGVYGKKDSIRIDVYEPTKNRTVCIYDIKTGKRGLSSNRMSEMSARVVTKYPNTERIIVTEVRPQQHVINSEYKKYYRCPPRGSR
jgi:hypothetical protein